MLYFVGKIFIITIRAFFSEGVLPGLGNEAGEEVLWQKYYQWVSIILCFQALLFYLPRYLWKTWEAGRMRLLVTDLGKTKGKT